MHYDHHHHQASSSSQFKHNPSIKSNNPSWCHLDGSPVDICSEDSHLFSTVTHHLRVVVVNPESEVDKPCRKQANRYSSEEKEKEPSKEQKQVVKDKDKRSPRR
jgi:hypothetical protein